MAYDWSSYTLTPDQIAKLSDAGYMTTHGSLDLGNGLMADAQRAGGSGQNYDPTATAFRIYNSTNPGTQYGMYDTSGKYTNTATMTKDDPLGNFLVPLLAAGGIYGLGQLGALGAAGSGGATVAGNAAAMTVPTEATWAAGANALESQLAPYLAGGTGGVVGGTVGASGAGGGGYSVAGNAAQMTVPTAAESAAAATGLQSSLAPYAAATGAGGASLAAKLAAATGLPEWAVQAGVGLLGAAAGSQGVKQSSTQTRDIPEWLKPYVTGSGGLLDSGNKLFQQQVASGMPGYQQMSNVGMGLLSQPVAGNGFNSFIAKSPYGK